MKPLVLIVEDELPQVELLRYNLEADGLAVTVASDGEEALLKIEEEAPDLVLLDWMLPGLSGMEVCRRLRQRSATRQLPIIILTARGEESDRIMGLVSGADDYVVKPFSPREVIARLRALLRRSRPALADEAIAYAGIAVDLAAHKVTRSGRPIHLSPIEFRLLATMLEQPGRVFSREQLLDRVWGHGIYVENRTVDATVRRLRQAINQGGEQDVIRTVRGFGYALDTELSRRRSERQPDPSLTAHFLRSGWTGAWRPARAAASLESGPAGSCTGLRATWRRFNSRATSSAWRDVPVLANTC
jgi:two-component system phosphate regulon response regulator PhoB